jgi:Domain of unknown function (DUF4129)
VNRRAAALVAGTAGTLLLCAWVSSTGPVGVFARGRQRRGPDTSAPGEEYGTTQLSPGELEGLRDGDNQQQPLFVDVMTVVLKVALAVVVLLVLVAATRALLQWWRSRQPGGTPAREADVLPEVILAGAREGEELLAHGTPANAVVAAWVALEDSVRAAGVRDDGSRTSAELVTGVLRTFRVEREPLDRLAALYREARFSTHPIGEEMRAQAVDALGRVRADLARAVRARLDAGVAR